MIILNDSRTTHRGIEQSLQTDTADASVLGPAIELSPELLDEVQGGVYVGPLSKLALYILGALGGII